ncbi:MAG: hypothetical protein RE471_05885 [Ferroplasma sp.]|uniref:hypothetical protein n=1 Tax=Ferroplasma sp. TaxID=2591003 RepID=UPI002814C84F|nr:hypothetical protein [Ferroplasma sp.]WMT50510.1 MAG: hypothetical protein RE471_05885 [Ferroplasma sp.]
MNYKKLITIVISILVIITVVIPGVIILDVHSDTQNDIYSPAKTGASSEYRFTSSLYYKSFQNNNSRYYNETLKNGDTYIRGDLFVNVSAQGANITSIVFNESGKVIKSLSRLYPINSTIFTSLFPEGNSLHRGEQLPFGNNIVNIENMTTICPPSSYKLNDGQHSIYYIPYNGVVSNVRDVYQHYNYSLFYFSTYLQSDRYAMIKSISIPGNSSVAAMIMGNIGIKTSYFVMSLIATNVKITDINYSRYVENYIPVLAVIWVIGIGYLVSKRKRRART